MTARYLLLESQDEVSGTSGWALLKRRAVACSLASSGWWVLDVLVLLLPLCLLAVLLRASPYLGVEDSASSFSFNESYALDVLHFAWAAYCLDWDINQWHCQWCDRIQDVRLVQVVHNDPDGTYGYVAVDAAHDRIVVAVRGTYNVPNGYEDAMFWKDTFPSGPDGVLVHRGFLLAYQSLNPDLRDAVVAGLEDCPWCGVLFTGHSLGAAVATLAAVDLAARPMAPTGGVSLYTFGSPRVGNAAFASWANELLGENSTRMTRQQDVVPSLGPEFSGYRHLSREVINRHKAGTPEWYVVCDDSGEDPRCHNAELTFSFNADEHLRYMGVVGGFCVPGWR